MVAIILSYTYQVLLIMSYFYHQKNKNLILENSKLDVNLPKTIMV